MALRKKGLSCSPEKKIIKTREYDRTSLKKGWIQEEKKIDEILLLLSK